ncbi:TetR/AcrR family transcriptional regulator [Streptomyces sp. Tu 2975]|uniref:TetR/AcrR family transcriptional regulator n=1 Tax=Streptomyces sp. Tu 2975 TaxID=2676871 RepID=UPI001357C755|nr:TetR/AcrR family transcriptional regulator [Streptomyces sp. Tu 2975]QIP87289.1 TetR/AcrR family transcriptional regulator [Streptomyces sp. Tu 2975]
MRDRLLDAVERLLVKGGVDAVRLDAVAAEAGVSKGGLLHHFPSKRALVEGVVQRLVDRFEAVLPGPDAPPGAYTLAWLDSSIPEVAPEPGTTGRDEVPIALLAATGGPEVLDVLQRHYRAWQERLDADGLPPGVSTLVRMAVDGWWTARLLRLAPPHGAAHAELRRLVADLIATGRADTGPRHAGPAGAGPSTTEPAGAEPADTAEESR